MRLMLVVQPLRASKCQVWGGGLKCRVVQTASRRSMALKERGHTRCNASKTLLRINDLQLEKTRNQALEPYRKLHQSRTQHDDENKRPLDSTSSPKPGTIAESPKTIRERVASLRPHENIWNVPNILTFSRIIAAPVVGYLVLHDQHLYAVALFAYAGITDLVDGWIARKWNLQTVIGTVIDPMADKMLMTILVVCLAIKGALPLWIATIILGRDISLSIAAFYYRYASLPPPKIFTRYFDFSLPSAEVHPTGVSKFNTFLQIVLIGATTAIPVVPTVLAGVDVPAAVQTLGWVVASTTVWSGMSYVWLKDAVTILGDDEMLKKKQGFRGRMIIGTSFAGFLILAAALARWQESQKDEKDTVE